MITGVELSVAEMELIDWVRHCANRAVSNPKEQYLSGTADAYFLMGKVHAALRDNIEREEEDNET